MPEQEQRSCGGNVDVEEDGKRIFRIKKWISIWGILESEEIWYE